ncbi:MAG: LUD domain-containing protein [Lachnospiraceae bacterium]|nr:LUD domain-containing protein [Lachnospiraceae bacterium]
MNENMFKRNELLAKKVIGGLESRNMKGYYAANKEEALQLALGLIPKGSSISMRWRQSPCRRCRKTACH